MKLPVPACLGLALALAFAGAAPAATGPTLDEVRQICAADFAKYCPDAGSNVSKFRSCARAHFLKLGKPCRRALMSYKGDSGAGATNATSP